MSANPYLEYGSGLALTPLADAHRFLAYAPAAFAARPGEFSALCAARVDEYKREATELRFRAASGRWVKYSSVESWLIMAAADAWGGGLDDWLRDNPFRMRWYEKAQSAFRRVYNISGQVRARNLIGVAAAQLRSGEVAGGLPDGILICNLSELPRYCMMCDTDEGAMYRSGGVLGNWHCKDKRACYERRKRNSPQAS